VPPILFRLALDGWCFPRVPRCKGDKNIKSSWFKKFLIREKRWFLWNELGGCRINRVAACLFAASRDDGFPPEPPSARRPGSDRPHERWGGVIGPETDSRVSVCFKCPFGLLRQTKAVGSGGYELLHSCLTIASAGFLAQWRQSNPRSWDKAPYASNGLYFTWSKVRVILEPNYCLAKLVGTWNYGIVRHDDPLASDEDAIFVVLDVPFAVIERKTIGSRTAIQPALALQRLKPGLQWIARPLTGWIADQDNGSSE